MWTLGDVIGNPSRLPEPKMLPLIEKPVQVMERLLEIRGGMLLINDTDRNHRFWPDEIKQVTEAVNALDLDDQDKAIRIIQDLAHYYRESAQRFNAAAKVQGWLRQLAFELAPPHWVDEPQRDEPEDEDFGRCQHCDGYH